MRELAVFRMREIVFVFHGSSSQVSGGFFIRDTAPSDSAADNQRTVESIIECRQLLGPGAPALRLDQRPCQIAGDLHRFGGRVTLSHETGHVRARRQIDALWQAFDLQIDEVFHGDLRTCRR